MHGFNLHLISKNLLQRRERAKNSKGKPHILNKVVGGSLSNPFICSCPIIVTTYVLLVFYHVAPIQHILWSVTFNLSYFLFQKFTIFRLCLDSKLKEKKKKETERNRRVGPKVKRKGATCLFKRKLKKLSVFPLNIFIVGEIIFLAEFVYIFPQNLFPSFLLSKHKGPQSFQIFPLPFLSFLSI